MNSGEEAPLITDGACFAKLAQWFSFIGHLAVFTVVTEIYVEALLLT